ncbi:MAG: hypothetical protein LUQ11_03810 [Methylococcaceae bacterium]|nr:hypothetical protein [Methylococcaceae bacterium]
MSVSVQTFIKTTLTATAMSFAVANSASANSWVGSDNVLGAGETITNIDVTDDYSLGGWVGANSHVGDGWGPIGHWYSFQLTDTAITTVTARARNATANAPAFTLYRTDIDWVPFGYDKNTTYPGWNVPGQTEGMPPNPSGSFHDMSQVAQAGQPGIVWASNNTPGGPGIVETLGYANSGDSYASNSWGQAVNYGANDVSIDNLYETGITGSVGQGFASLTLNNLKAGWYTIFVGGANTSLAGSPSDVTVSAVPVPGAVYLFGTALAGLATSSRRQKNLG